MMEYRCVLFDRNTLEQKGNADIMQMSLQNTVLVNAIINQECGCWVMRDSRRNVKFGSMLTSLWVVILLLNTILTM